MNFAEEICLVFKSFPKSDICKLTLRRAFMISTNVLTLICDGCSLKFCLYASIIVKVYCMIFYQCKHMVQDLKDVTDIRKKCNL